MKNTSLVEICSRCRQPKFKEYIEDEYGFYIGENYCHRNFIILIKDSEYGSVIRRHPIWVKELLHKSKKL